MERRGRVKCRRRAGFGEKGTRIVPGDELGFEKQGRNGRAKLPRPSVVPHAS